MQEYYKNGPVVIGGVGGSGTRVVAEILSSFGFYIGDDLNEASDNLLYTLIFKRPKWYYRNHTNKQAINIGLSLFHKLMTGINTLTYQEIRFLICAIVSMAFWGHNHLGSGRGIWTLKRLIKIIVTKRHMISSEYIGWGWKEPNSFLLLRHMNDYFENFKYIHMIRHGLDMAFSNNQQQLYNWGPLFGIKKPASPSQVPSAALKYWIRANQHVFQIGKEIGQDKFLLVKFEELCESPEPEVQKIISFLKISPDEKVYRQALSIPKKIKSIGRYRKHDLNQFNKDDLIALQRLGFSI